MSQQYIVFTDPHIEESCIVELDKVFNEIALLSRGRPILVCVGDYYEKKYPTPREQYFGTMWALKFKKCFKDFIMVTGNHPDIDGKISSVSYLKLLGIQTVPEIVLDGTYYGHYMVKESLCGFNETHEGKDLTNAYNLSILGHQHSFQVITIGGNRIVHLGSCRYVDFGEAQDRHKYVMLVDECDFKEIPLSSVRPMIEVGSVNNLVGTPADCQVRIVYKSFSHFLSEASEVEKIQNKFFKFKVKLDFQNVPQQSTINTNNSNKEIVRKWLDKIDNPDVKRELENEFRHVLK